MTDSFHAPISITFFHAFDAVTFLKTVHEKGKSKCSNYTMISQFLNLCMTDHPREEHTPLWQGDIVRIPKRREQ